MYVQKGLNDAQQQISVGRTFSTGMLAVTQEYSTIFQSGEGFFEGDKCNPTILEWFLFQLVISLRKFTWERRVPTTEEIYLIDDFYYDLTHNPYLVLLHRYLDKLSIQQDQEAKLKLCFLIREYFVRDAVRQFEKQPSSGLQYGSSYVTGRGRKAHYL
jgi:hypothetical protein